MIVGFPTETEEEFLDTMKLTEQVRYDQQFMFMYSPRRGTIAADEMKNDVLLADKKSRLHRLIELQEQISLEKNQEELHKTHEVLVEGPARRGDDMMGRSRTDKTVVFPGTEDMIGKLENVKIVEAWKHTLRGELIVDQSADQKFEDSVANQGVKVGS